MNKEGEKYVKRTQKDYSMSFKMNVVYEIERGEIFVLDARKKYSIQGQSTVLNWLKKYGKFDWEYQMPNNMPRSKDSNNHALDRRLIKTEPNISLIAFISYHEILVYTFM